MRSSGPLLGSIAVLAALYSLPWWMQQPYVLHVLTVALIYAVMATSLNLSFGYTGMLSLGHMAFAGVGAYAAALLALRLGVPYWAAFALGVMAAGLAGALVGVAAVRLRGHSLVIVTLAFGLIMHLIFNNWDGVTGGPVGLPGTPRPPAFAWGPIRSDMTRAGDFYLLVLTVALAAAGAQRLIVGSGFGHILVAVREDEDLAALRGVDVRAYKTTSLAFSAMLAGAGGILLGSYLRIVAPQSFDLLESINLVLIVIVGGAGTLLGPVVGAALFIGIPEYLRFARELRLVIFGAVLVLLVLFAPEGVVRLAARPWRRPRPRQGDPKGELPS